MLLTQCCTGVPTASLLARGRHHDGQRDGQGKNIMLLLQGMLHIDCMDIKAASPYDSRCGKVGTLILIKSFNVIAHCTTE